MTRRGSLRVASPRLVYGAGRMSDESRTCHHAACTAPASVALAFRYDSRQVWLRPLGQEAHPAVHELCLDHADRLTVPRGWDQIDERGSPGVTGLAGEPYAPEPSQGAERSRANAEDPRSGGAMREVEG